MGTFAALVADIETPDLETSASPTFGGGANPSPYESFRFVPQYS